MTNNRKQLKITKIFRKGAVTKLPDENDELHEELQQLEQKLREKQNELFQIQRNSYRKKLSPPKRKEESFIRPQKIILNNSVESLQRDLELISMLTGVEVQSYVANEHCCVVYHMQHKSENVVKHGLRIDMSAGGNIISKSSLPVGFNLNAIMEDFDNIMMPECLGAIRRGLVAYYNRLEQFEALEKLLYLEAEMFKILDGSHIEISFFAQDATEDDEDQFNVTLILEYRLYDIRPKTYTFKEIDLPDGASEILREQCIVFKRKPLNKAFKEAFLNDVGKYRLVQRLGTRNSEEFRKPKRLRPNKHNFNNDDTFHPEDCSDQGEDDNV